MEVARPHPRGGLSATTAWDYWPQSRFMTDVLNAVTVLALGVLVPAILAWWCIKTLRKRRGVKTVTLPQKDWEGLRLLGFIFIAAAVGAPFVGDMDVSNSWPLQIFFLILGGGLSYLAARKLRAPQYELDDGPDYIVDPEGVAKHTGKPRTDYAFLKKR